MGRPQWNYFFGKFDCHLWVCFLPEGTTQELETLCCFLGTSAACLGNLSDFRGLTALVTGPEADCCVHPRDMVRVLQETSRPEVRVSCPEGFSLSPIVHCTRARR